MNMGLQFFIKKISPNFVLIQEMYQNFAVLFCKTQHLNCLTVCSGGWVPGTWQVDETTQQGVPVEAIILLPTLMMKLYIILEY